MTRLRQRKLYKVIKKRTRADHRTKLYLIFVNWLEIRKQKDRRRRKKSEGRGRQGRQKKEKTREEKGRRVSKCPAPA